MTANFTYSERIDELEGFLAAQKAQLRDLATMGAVITSIHEIDAVLSVVMDMALRLVDGEVGLINVGADDHMKTKVSWGVSNDFVQTIKCHDGLDIVSSCFENRTPVIMNDMNLRSNEGILLNSVIAMPIITKDKCLGVLVIINKAGGGHYAEEDREILEMLLSFVAVAIDNSNLMKDKLEKQKMEQDLAIARQVQETILPKNIENIPGVEIGAVYYPAREVGGDFYDILTIDEQRFIVILGDVSNKGIPAALIMSAASGIIKSIMSQEPAITIAGLAAKLNDLLAGEIIRDREMFVTLFFCKFDLEKKKLTFCNAGHLPGLFWDNAQRRVMELSQGGPIVGQFPGIKFKAGEIPINGNDRLFLFTDGLTEAADHEGNLFGRERAEQVYRDEIGLSPVDFCRKVKDWVDRFSEGAAEDTQDDFTVLQVKVKQQ
ncbi:MAG: PP2C family protein-serine/threonine phosphatase [Candidatus Zixiibacteriota bacterium]